MSEAVKLYSEPIKLIGPDDVGMIDGSDTIEFSPVEIGDNIQAWISFFPLPLSLRKEEGRVLHLSQNGVRNISYGEACEGGLSRAYFMAQAQGENIREPMTADLSLDEKKINVRVLMQNETVPDSVDVISEFAGRMWKSSEFPAVLFKDMCVKFDFNDMSLIRGISARFQMGGDLN